MTIHDCHDFHAFPPLRRSDLRPATLRHHERRIDEAFRFIRRTFVATLVGYHVISTGHSWRYVLLLLYSYQDGNMDRFHD
jgi:hypothetical protein